MANTFKNAGVAITNSATVIYTAPASTTGVVHAIYISNIHASSDGTVDIFVTDTSSGNDFILQRIYQYLMDLLQYLRNHLI